MIFMRFIFILVYTCVMGSKIKNDHSANGNSASKRRNSSSSFTSKKYYNTVPSKFYNNSGSGSGNGNESAVKLNRHLEEAHDITIDPKNRRCGFLLKFKDDLNGNGNASGTQKDTPFDPYFYFRPKIRQTEAKVDFNGKSENNSSAAATGSTAGSSKADEGVCLVCGKVFMLKEEARKHLLLYHGISGNAASHAGHSSLSCYELENVEFEDMEKVYKSLSSTSSSAKSFTCQLCFMALKSHESLVRHFRIVHDIRVLPPQQQKHDNGVDAQQDNTQMFHSKMEMENMAVLVAVRDD
ncbi:hypothetical protein MP638_005253 [Amoeboaphelidium occidentale]|nr:hypothetical protein MP638_005253 [Amoeboaphelidium occidentale]